MIFYTADPHFGDERIMKLCQRPYPSVAEMDEDLIARWNRAVSSEDIVYLVGDVAVDDETACRILPRLRGHKHLIVGNHDSVLKESRNLFESISLLRTIQDDGRSVCLCHYPLLSYENSVYGGYHVFGHIHNNPADPACNLVKSIPRIYHAGVDVCDYTPQTLDALMERKS